jgi:hypothetical protein
VNISLQLDAGVAETIIAIRVASASLVPRKPRRRGETMDPTTAPVEFWPSELETC